MAAVKGSKQYEMVVVPWRPWYRATVFCALLLVMGLLGWVAWRMGMEQGLSLREEVVRERDTLEHRLAQNEKLVADLRQEIADLKVGGQIDTRANEEVRRTVESLQARIAELREEIRFYKGVMLPNVEDTGLRIERMTLKPGNEPGRVEYSLLLTQVVDKHDYIQGGVDISVVGMVAGAEKRYGLGELSDQENSTGFRFRYFQNLEGTMRIPAEFEPRAVVVVARSSGRNGQRLEKQFQWQLSGG